MDSHCLPPPKRAELTEKPLKGKQSPQGESRAQTLREKPKIILIFAHVRSPVTIFLLSLFSVSKKMCPNWLCLEQCVSREIKRWLLRK